MDVIIQRNKLKLYRPLLLTKGGQEDQYNKHQLEDLFRKYLVDLQN